MSSITFPHSDVSTSQLGKKSPHFKWAGGPFIMLQEFKNSNTHAMMSELAGVCREQLAMNNDAVKHQRAHMHRRVTSSGEAAVAMTTVSLSALCHQSLHLWLFSFRFTFCFSLHPELSRPLTLGWRLFVVFLSFSQNACRHLLGHLAQTHSFVINSCPHL